jgi:hypothetical protein
MFDKSENNKFSKVKEVASVLTTLFMIFALPVTVFLAMRPQDIRQSAAGEKTATIGIAPSSGSFAPGKEITLSLVIDGGGQEFKTAQANVTLSNNLTVQSLTITPKESGGCDFVFDNPSNIPTASNPSFAGEIVNSSAKYCTLYTMTAKPEADGPASITITQPSVIGYENQGEIFSSMINGLYTIKNSASVATSQDVTLTENKDFTYQEEMGKYPPAWVFLTAIILLLGAGGTGGYFAYRYFRNKDPYEGIPIENINPAEKPPEKTAVTNTSQQLSGMQAFNLADQTKEKP